MDDIVIKTTQTTNIFTLKQYVKFYSILQFFLSYFLFFVYTVYTTKIKTTYLKIADLRKQLPHLIKTMHFLLHLDLTSVYMFL